MSAPELALIACIFAAAVLYSSVGHAGGSGYLAAMALFSVAPDRMKPAALVLNILVALITSLRFIQAKAVAWPLLGPTVLASIPMAFLGGMLNLDGRWYKVLVALALLAAAVRLAMPKRDSEQELVKAPIWQLVLLGAGIGILSGLTGVGGGIYLTPVILFAGWAYAREASGVSALFILANSISGLAGRWQASTVLPAELPYWAVAAGVGGLIGSHLGVRKFGSAGLKRVLAVVLIIAAVKLAFA